MTTRADYTAEEWAELARAPFAAGLYVVLSAPSGPIGVIQEMSAMVGRVHTAATAQADNQLVTALAQALITREGQQQFKVEARDKVALLEVIRQAAPVLARVPADEAAGYRAWIATIAERAAGAASEGGLFGLGKTAVSAAETVAISEVKAAVAG
ncbi:MAG: hypothetical protein IT340_15225 [Chloroflexi bacterium]|nr:hypothetical protein [Chloroflexota bacterium]